MSLEEARARVALLVPAERLERGITALERVHADTRALVEGRGTRTLEHDDYGYAGYYIHLLTPALRAIAADGWVERHLADFALLATSPELADCCRATVVELFGVQAFHVAIQHYALSDGLVRELCHGHWDKIQTIRRIGGQLVHLRTTYGSYRPTVLPGYAVCNDGPVFDAIPVS